MANRRSVRGDYYQNYTCLLVTRWEAKEAREAWNQRMQGTIGSRGHWEPKDARNHRKQGSTKWAAKALTRLRRIRSTLVHLSTDSDTERHIHAAMCTDPPSYSALSFSPGRICLSQDRILRKVSTHMLRTLRQTRRTAIELLTQAILPGTKEGT